MGKNLPRSCAQQIALLCLPVMWTVCLSREAGTSCAQSLFLASAWQLMCTLCALTVHNVFSCYISSAYSLP